MIVAFTNPGPAFAVDRVRVFFPAAAAAATVEARVAAPRVGTIGGLPSGVKST